MPFWETFQILRKVTKFSKYNFDVVADQNVCCLFVRIMSNRWNRWMNKNYIFNIFFNFEMVRSIWHHFYPDYIPFMPSRTTTVAVEKPGWSLPLAVCSTPLYVTVRIAFRSHRMDECYVYTPIYINTNITVHIITYIITFNDIHNSATRSGDEGYGCSMLEMRNSTIDVWDVHWSDPYDPVCTKLSPRLLYEKWSSYQWSERTRLRYSACYFMHITPHLISHTNVKIMNNYLEYVGTISGDPRISAQIPSWSHIPVYCFKWCTEYRTESREPRNEYKFFMLYTQQHQGPATISPAHGSILLSIMSRSNAWRWFRYRYGRFGHVSEESKHVSDCIQVDRIVLRFNSLCYGVWCCLQGDDLVTH